MGGLRRGCHSTGIVVAIPGLQRNASLWFGDDTGNLVTSINRSTGIGNPSRVRIVALYDRAVGACGGRVGGGGNVDEGRLFLCGCGGGDDVSSTAAAALLARRLSGRHGHHQLPPDESL